MINSWTTDMFLFQNVNNNKGNTHPHTSAANNIYFFAIKVWPLGGKNEPCFSWWATRYSRVLIYSNKKKTWGGVNKSDVAAWLWLFLTFMGGIWKTSVKILGQSKGLMVTRVKEKRRKGNRRVEYIEKTSPAFLFIQTWPLSFILSRLFAIRCSRLPWQNLKPVWYLWQKPVV